MLLETEKPPNKHTRAMGELIRQAREDAGLTQEQLAEKINRKRLAVSEMENGKVEISAWTIPLLASALNKPISYFYPKYVRKEITQEDLEPIEQEILMHFRNIWGKHLRRVAINVIKAIADFDPIDMVKANIDTINAVLEQDEEIEEFLNQRRNKK